MKCIKLTYRKKNGEAGEKVVRVSDSYASNRVGNSAYTAKAEYCGKEEWKATGRKRQ